MKKLTQISLMMACALMIAFTGCDKAKEAAKGAKDKATDLTKIEFGDFDMEGLKTKFDGITDGFKDVSAESVDGLKSKITGLSGAVDGMGIDKLEGPAKKAFGGVLATFTAAVTKAMSSIKDEGILAKLKPAVDGLMKKFSPFKLGN